MGRERVVLGDVAPVTGPRRAVTHCDRACTNAQRPNTPQVLRYPDRCSLSATMAVALSSSPPFVRNISRPRRSCVPAIAHTPENLLPYISRERSFAPCFPLFISYLLFLLILAYSHLHYSTSFTVKCVRSKACVQTFCEPLIWALTSTYPLCVCLALRHKSGRMKTFQCA